MSKKVILFLVIAGILPPLSIADAQQAIFLVRHAEQSADVEDPPLTETGHRRAKALARMLKGAGVNVIYGSELKRTIQTAEPLAKELNVQIKTMSRRDIDGLINRLRTEHANDRVLIVSHAFTVPRLLKALGYPVEITVGHSEYDNLFIVIPRADGQPTVVHFRY